MPAAAPIPETAEKTRADRWWRQGADGFNRTYLEHAEDSGAAIRVYYAPRRERSNYLHAYSIEAAPADAARRDGEPGYRRFDIDDMRIDAAGLDPAAMAGRLDGMRGAWERQMMSAPDIPLGAPSPRRSWTLSNLVRNAASECAAPAASRTVRATTAFRASRPAGSDAEEVRPTLVLRFQTPAQRELALQELLNLAHTYGPEGTGIDSITARAGYEEGRELGVHARRGDEELAVTFAGMAVEAAVPGAAEGFADRVGALSAQLADRATVYRATRMDFPNTGARELLSICARRWAENHDVGLLRARADSAPESLTPEQRRAVEDWDSGQPARRIAAMDAGYGFDEVDALATDAELAAYVRNVESEQDAMRVVGSARERNTGLRNPGRRAAREDLQRALAERGLALDELAVHGMGGVRAAARGALASYGLDVHSAKATADAAEAWAALFPERSADAGRPLPELPPAGAAAAHAADAADAVAAETRRSREETIAEQARRQQAVDAALADIGRQKIPKTVISELKSRMGADEAIDLLMQAGAGNVRRINGGGEAVASSAYCPFENHLSQSSRPFVVYSDGSCHCFHCDGGAKHGQSYDVIQLYMKAHGVRFKTAVAHLCRDAGMDLDGMMLDYYRANPDKLWLGRELSGLRRGGKAATIGYEFEKKTDPRTGKPKRDPDTGRYEREPEPTFRGRENVQEVLAELKGRLSRPVRHDAQGLEMPKLPRWRQAQDYMRALTAMMFYDSWQFAKKRGHVLSEGDRDLARELFGELRRDGLRGAGLPLPDGGLGSGFWLGRGGFESNTELFDGVFLAISFDDMKAGKGSVEGLTCGAKSRDWLRSHKAQIARDSAAARKLASEMKVEAAFSKAAGYEETAAGLMEEAAQAQARADGLESVGDRQGARAAQREVQRLRAQASRLRAAAAVERGEEPAGALPAPDGDAPDAGNARAAAARESGKPAPDGAHLPPNADAAAAERTGAREDGRRPAPVRPTERRGGTLPPDADAADRPGPPAPRPPARTDAKAAGSDVHSNGEISWYADPDPRPLWQNDPARIRKTFLKLAGMGEGARADFPDPGNARIGDAGRERRAALVARMTPGAGPAERAAAEQMADAYLSQLGRLEALAEFADNQARRDPTGESGRFAADCRARAADIREMLHYPAETMRQTHWTYQKIDYGKNTHETIKAHDIAEAETLRRLYSGDGKVGIEREPSSREVTVRSPVEEKGYKDGRMEARREMKRWDRDAANASISLAEKIDRSMSRLPQRPQQPDGAGTR